MKCLPTLRLLMTLPTFTPILSASFTRPACTDALILPSSFSVAASRDSRLAARCAASAGLRQQISRSPGYLASVISAKFWSSNSDICSGPSSRARAAMEGRAGR